ncbi:CDA_G0027270.mRNA.1.CDS.1 [Saccharomyces cerevisiae]|nr:CDA_G0027270.mRNA.1.CDS.1 [Saccharomyces cerevisiae]CAI7246426.1 CDA_G0027270.mRNA.1.CDS.1 [Saccharomyces cerevisiae]
MTFFLKRKISFFLSGIAQTFLFLPILLNRSVIHVVFLTVVLGHRMPWDSVIRCNNTGAQLILRYLHGQNFYCLSVV